MRSTLPARRHPAMLLPSDFRVWKMILKEEENLYIKRLDHGSEEDNHKADSKPAKDEVFMTAMDIDNDIIKNIADNEKPKPVVVDMEDNDDGF
jgi:hypothetical protein